MRVLDRDHQLLRFGKPLPFLKVRLHIGKEMLRRGRAAGDIVR